MKPCAPLVLGTVAVSLLALGCEPKKPTDQQETSMVDMRYDALEPPAEAGSVASSEADTDAYAAEDDDRADSDTEGTGEVGTVYIVRPKDTLYAIARTYYEGDQTKWRLIYEANRERIDDPNLIYVGMKLIIPPATAQ
jgi:nucleoid-associated protein YgaU